jgi:nitroreductase
MTGDGIFDLNETDKLLSTTRAVRKRLDFDRAVPMQVITDCLKLAQQAPTGSNSQGWSWLVITDQEKRQALAEMYRKGAGSYLTDGEKAAKAEGASQNLRVFSSAQFLAENLQQAPVHVIPCINVAHVAKDAPPAAWAGVMGSIFPAVWNFQLALRSRGLGSTLTTLHLRCASDAAELLGLPDDVMQVALLPVAYTKGQDFKQAKRPPVTDIIHYEHW